MTRYFRQECLMPPFRDCLIFFPIYFRFYCEFAWLYMKKGKDIAKTDSASYHEKTFVLAYFHLSH